MFDLDKWQEIFATLRQNSLRTFLTALSVAWGILMLIILLGAGNGLSNGVAHNFRDDAINSIWIRPGQTSLPYNGTKPGRNIQLTNTDYDLILRVPGVEYGSARFYISGATTVSYNGEFGNFSVRCVHPEYRHIENTLITQGRYLNAMDQEQHRKVVVIGEKVYDALYLDGGDPIGTYVNINNIPFKVIGVFTDEGSEGEQERLYLPISTGQHTFNGQNRINQMQVSIGDAGLIESERITQIIQDRLSRRHNYDPEDPRAMYVRNNMANFQRFQNVTGGINLFIWVIGLMTITAGVIGVSNIMLIVVKERTKEIGVRKAIGAPPRTIISMILTESIFLTGLSGFVGLMLGVGILEGVNVILENMGGGNQFFRNPEVDLGIAIQALIVLIVAGTLAGLVPALRAARIRPIEALRDE